MSALLARISAALKRALECVVMAVMAVLVLDVLWGVFTRRALGHQSRWTEELATFLLVWVSLLGAAVAYGQRSHLGLDYFFNKLHPEAKRLAEIGINGIVAVFAAVVMVGGGYVLVVRNLASGQLSAALQVEMAWVYLAVPLSGLFILLFCAENVVELARGREEPPAPAAAREDIV
jgi:TRAP-type C4-dicarboxylate transport system permease small subunit